MYRHRKVIGRNTHIKSLNIYKDGDTCPIGYYEYELFLAEVAKNKSLTELSLGEIMSRSSEAIKILTPLFENNGIQSLTFGNCTGAHIQQLSSALLGCAAPTLEQLHLTGSERYCSLYSDVDAMDDTSGAILITILNDRHCIKQLTLDYSRFDKKTCLALKNMLSNPSCKLKELTLQYNKIGDEGLDILANGFVNNNSLEMLNLNASGGARYWGFTNLFSILQQPNSLDALRILHLDNNSNITDGGVISLATAFGNNNTSLKELYIRWNTSITTVGWQALSKVALGVSALATIDITNSGSSFDDPSVFASS